MKKIFNLPLFKSQLLTVLLGKMKRVPWILAKDAFLFMLIFILASALFGEFLFYRYVSVVKNQEPEMGAATAKFKEGVYQSVLKEMQARENLFQNPSGENYTSPFF